MRALFRKILAPIVIVNLLTQIAFPILPVFASGELNMVVKLNNASLSNGGTILVDPDSSSPNNAITFDIQGGNFNPTEEPIKDVVLTASFGNNAGFTYDGTSLKANIDGTDTTAPLPSSVYSSTSGLIIPITTASYPTVDPYLGMSVGPMTNNNIIANQNLTTYRNDAWVAINATTTDTNTAVSTTPFIYTIYANVKPHVTDAYFEKLDGSTTTSQIQGASAEAINFVVVVKDSNGAANMMGAGASVTADLSFLGLGVTSLSPVSSAGNTVTYKKTGIVTNQPTGTGTISIGSIVATDQNGNVNNRNDSYFVAGVDKITDVTIAIVSPAAPSVSLTSISDTQIGGALEPSSTIVFTSNQNGETKVTLWGDSLCSGGTILEDWTGSGSYVLGNPKSITVNASSLAEGANTINLCARTAAQIVGSLSTTITKKTTAPILSGLTYSPSSVTTGDVSATFSCNADGEASIEQGGTVYGSGTFVSSGSIISGGTKTLAIANTLLSNGSNTFKAYCRDTYGNTSSGGTITVSKNPPTPAMTGTPSLADNDVDLDGLSGYDLSISWDTSAGVGFGSYFESYRLYVLPNGTAFNAGTQSAISVIPSASSGSFVGTSAITKDSLNTTLVSGASYIACVAIMGTSGLLGTPVCSSAAVITADTVAHPTISSARFTNDTTLEVTTNATLDTNLSSHSGGLLTYTIGSTSYHPTGVSSVNGTKILFTIPSLGSTAAVGTITDIGANAIHANGGGYNVAATPSVAITDRQAPVISGFTKSTAPIYGNFYKGSISISYTFNEAMSTDGSSKIDIVRTGGNPDSTPHSIPLSDTSETSAGTKGRVINLDALSLVSGTTYQIRITGNDLAGNAASAQTISNISYDITGPAAPTITDATTFGTLTPTLSWAAAIDNLGNGSGVKKYVLFVYAGGSCNPSAIQSHTNIDPSTRSIILESLPSNGATYSWTIESTDNLDNAGSVSSCDSFAVDTTIPTISSTSLRDTTLNSNSWAKIGNSATLSATILNTDSSHIWADLSLLTGNGGDSHISCASPTAGVSCSYAGNTVSYTFTIGNVVQNVSRIATLSAQNAVGINDTSANASITVDSTAPGVTSSTITAPNGGETWGGTTRTITWNTANITDAGGVASITLEYSSDGGGNWTSLGNIPNTGSYTWSIGGLPSTSNYLVRITAIDNAGNSASDTSNATFTIDLSVPVVDNNTITSPNGNEVWKGATTKTISWNPAGITDSNGLIANPISLEYSPDNGSSWNTIATNLPNSGSYNWTTPSGNIAGAKIRLTATDLAGNTTTDTSNASFAIDSTNPTLSISYAGGGGSTPQNGRKINSSGLDLSVGATDTHLQAVSYTFENTTDHLFFVGGSWVGSNASNLLCTDNVNPGTSTLCSNIPVTTVNPAIENGKSYALTFSATDEAGNITTSATSTYIGDTVVPNLTSTTNATGGFFSGSLIISGTSSDAGSSVGSVTVKIQRGAEYWNGSSWTVTSTELLTSTSNAYANYSYTFIPPGADADGTAYSVSIQSYDNAYKTANVATASQSATLDKVGPSIASDVFTFDTATVRRGGQSMTITWDTNKVTTSGSPLASNPISLSYNFTGSIVSIASNIANNGSYTFTLPAADTTGRIIMSAVDALGNSSSNVPSNLFTVDSTPPSVTSIETADFDANGQIDGFILTTSENVNTTEINASEFSVSDSITLSPSVTATNVGAITTIELHFTANYGNTASLPTLSYNGTSVVDIVGNPLVSFTNRAPTDKASPRALSASVLDTDTNGRINAIDVTFSEPLANTADISTWTLNNALPGMSIASVSVSSNVVRVHLNESTTQSTAVGSMTLGFTANTNYHDIAGNQAGSLASPLTPTDSAVPQVIAVSTVDVNQNGKMDAIRVTFSENVTGTDAGWNITGLATGASYAGGGSISGNIFTLPLNETSLSSDSATTPSVSYTPGNIIDTASNALVARAGMIASDGVSPIILSRSTLDSNGNGYIDRIVLHASETLAGNTAGATVSITGYNVIGTSLSGSDIITTITEGSTPDTGATPLTQLTSIGGITDTSGNATIAESSASAATDAAGPIIASAQYGFGATSGVSDDVITVTFSESINTPSLAVGDFLIHNGGSIGSATLQNVTTTSAEIHLAADSTAATPGTSTISLASGGVNDTIWNPSPTEGTQNRIIILPPVIINEVMWSSVGSKASQYIELHNLGSASIDIGNWKIRNAGGNGVDITIPGGTILAGNAYYLVTRNTPGTNGSDLVGGITADLVSGTLSLSASQNSLILENANSVAFDQAKANPWSAGSDSQIVSMERNGVAGDGLVAGNWHSGVVNRTSFTSGGSYGTPRAANEEDGTSPVFTTSETQGVLKPTFSNNFTYSVSDNYSINWSTFSATLERYNGSSWSQTGTITTDTGATTVFHTTVPTYGKYRITTQVADPSGNIGNAQYVFYADAASASISAGSVHIGTLDTTSTVESTPITITVQTVGAGVNIQSIGENAMTLSGGITEHISAWNGTKGYGIKWSVTTPTGSGNIAAAGTLTANPVTLFSDPTVSPENDGSLKTYTIALRYGGKVDDVTAAGLYRAASSLQFSFGY